MRYRSSPSRLSARPRTNSTPGHGRKFLSQELKDYFNDKTWYEGTVDPDSFSPGVFNTYENDNLLLLVSAEEKLLPGGYVLDQQGYDIHKVDTACKHTLGETAKTGDAFGYVFVVIDSDNIMHDDARLVNGKVVDANGNEIPGCYEREDGRWQMPWETSSIPRKASW